MEYGQKTNVTMRTLHVNRAILDDEVEILKKIDQMSRQKCEYLASGISKMQRDSSALKEIINVGKRIFNIEKQTKRRKAIF